jgi:hypothetical protein
MYRAFQTAMAVHKPDVVFVLGEFLIKFENPNLVITGVVVFSQALKSPLAVPLHAHFSFQYCGY